MLNSMFRKKSKGPLQTLLDEQIARTPDLIAGHLVKDKLKGLGIDDPVLVDLVVRFVRGDRSAALEAKINERLREDVTIEFDEADLKRIDRCADELVKSLPQMVTDIAQQAAGTMLKEYKAAWAEYRPHELEQLATFKQNLQKRWGEGLDGLRMLLEMCRDVGQEYMAEHLPANRRRPKYKEQALAALHVRACQVTSEVICLMENGYADGAIARWRTLHEISVIATLIGDGDEALAQRYLDHQAVDEKRALDTYEASQAMLGDGPTPKSQTRATIATYERTLRKYGSEFGGHFGWAAGYYNGNKNPKFIHLQEAAGRASMQTDYKMASYNVHASASGLFQRLSASIGSALMVAGASNAGLTDPGQYTAYSLLQITAQLHGSDWDIDKIAHVITLVFLRNEIPDALQAAEKKLKRDEAKAEFVRNRRVIRPKVKVPPSKR